MFAAGFDAELSHEAIVLALTHGGIEIDHMQPAVVSEPIEQAQNIGNGKFPFAPVYELNRLATLQINAGNQHGSLTVMPLDWRNSFNARMDCTWS